MRIFILSAAMMAAFAGFPAQAEEPSTNGATRIEVDTAHKAFVFIIDDKPVALLDKEGLHVREGIVYGSTLTDAGIVSFDKRVDQFEKEAAHD